jgi:hypothetical protein
MKTMRIKERVLNNFVSMVFATTLKFLYDHFTSQSYTIVFNDHKSVNYIFVNILFLHISIICLDKNPVRIFTRT